MLLLLTGNMGIWMCAIVETLSVWRCSPRLLMVNRRAERYRVDAILMVGLMLR